MTSRERKKRFIFKVLTVLISTSVCVSALVGIDLYLHYRHGINLRGYRGPSLGRKQAGEKRVAILGGSTTWGYGLKAGQDFPAQLQTMLASSSLPNASRVNTLNLGFNNEGVYSFRPTLEDYEYLKPDVIVLYSGYNDLQPSRNTYVSRHESPIFIWTGFLPLLPSFAMERLERWKRSLSGTDKRTIFKPPQNSGARTARGLQEQVGTLSQTNATTNTTTETCPPRWQFYCEQVSEAVSLALKEGRRVLVVTEPYISNEHIVQQTAMANMLSVRFRGNPNVRYLNLGNTVDLRDTTLCWDGMHLTQEGNRRIAAGMVQSVVELLR